MELEGFCLLLGRGVPLLNQNCCAKALPTRMFERVAMENRETSALQVEDLTYNGDGLIPCIVQDSETREVLMMAWMNEESVRRTLEQKTTWFWSRSRQKFWHKGEESGNTQKLVELRYDCDADCLLALVVPAGPACHTGENTCFYRSF